MTHAMVLTALTEEVKKLTCPSHGLLPSKSSIETSENGRQTMANFVLVIVVFMILIFSRGCFFQIVNTITALLDN